MWHDRSVTQTFSQNNKLRFSLKCTCVRSSRRSIGRKSLLHSNLDTRVTNLMSLFHSIHSLFFSFFFLLHIFSVARACVSFRTFACRGDASRTIWNDMQMKVVNLGWNSRISQKLTIWHQFLARLVCVIVALLLTSRLSIVRSFFCQCGTLDVRNVNRRKKKWRWRENQTKRDYFLIG